MFKCITITNVDLSAIWVSIYEMNLYYFSSTNCILFWWTDMLHDWYFIEISFYKRFISFLFMISGLIICQWPKDNTVYGSYTYEIYFHYNYDWVENQFMHCHFKFIKLFENSWSSKYWLLFLTLLLSLMWMFKIAYECKKEIHWSLIILPSV